MKETGRNGFQTKVIEALEEEFKGCIVLLNDASLFQGVPDLLVLFNDRWAALEVKKSTKAARQPNQEYWTNKFDEMSFGAFISHENKEEVFYALRQTFGVI